MWFAGYHTDVGGGLSEKESALCKVPLQWMIGRARQCGLKFNTRSINILVAGKGDDPKYIIPDPLAGTHNSMKRLWPMLEFIPRKTPEHSKRWSLIGLVLPLFELRYVPDDAAIHRSIEQRRNALDLWPRNIPIRHRFED